MPSCVFLSPLLPWMSPHTAVPGNELTVVQCSTTVSQVRRLLLPLNVREWQESTLSACPLGSRSPCDGVTMCLSSDLRAQLSFEAHTLSRHTNKQLFPSPRGCAHLWLKGPPEQVPLGRCSCQVVTSLWLDVHLRAPLQSRVGVGGVNLALVGDRTGSKCSFLLGWNLEVEKNHTQINAAN